MILTTLSNLYVESYVHAFLWGLNEIKSLDLGSIQKHPFPFCHPDNVSVEEQLNNRLALSYKSLSVKCRVLCVY